MTPRWFRLRRSSRHRPDAGERPKGEISTGRPEPERGPRVLLKCLDGDAEGTEILAALSKRYEITALGSESRQFEILIDDAVYPDEAVVRLASVLDEIDHDWGAHIGWPRVQA